MQILEQLSEYGEEVDMYQSMNRLCAILDFDQYREFIAWVNELKVIKPKQLAENISTPFIPKRRPDTKFHDKAFVSNIEAVWGISIS
ncbi:hypothetical protein [Amphritea pacifica]|uniref:Uncharacterized protein n=1 Tax=Amphritea pacifica TaxID=2811233 RepID=A0ABS2W8Y5_9GAMM|nr:hypothetical protein [Amphritea pacifica]MBN0988033.1 hypothetical protein [Amphritea pacifica]MBN1006681.1 hypothetical protein [Amphritea pacifica]